MQTQTITLYVAADGRRFDTPQAARNHDFTAAWEAWKLAIHGGNYVSPNLNLYSDDPAKVDQALDRAFELLRSIRAANQRRKV